MTCPRCGSPDAVSKADAWDALASVPPKTQAELEDLRKLEAAAQLLYFYGRNIREGAVTLTVDAELYQGLIDAYAAVGKARGLPTAKGDGFAYGAAGLASFPATPIPCSSDGVLDEDVRSILAGE